MVNSLLGYTAAMLDGKRPSSRINVRYFCSTDVRKLWDILAPQMCSNFGKFFITDVPEICCIFVPQAFQKLGHFCASDVPKIWGISVAQTCKKMGICLRHRCAENLGYFCASDVPKVGGSLCSGLAKSEGNISVTEVPTGYARCHKFLCREQGKEWEGRFQLYYLGWGIMMPSKYQIIRKNGRGISVSRISH